mgnify:CR=1 FL=1
MRQMVGATCIRYQSDFGETLHKFCSGGRKDNIAAKYDICARSYKILVEDYQGDFNKALSQYRHRHDKVTAAKDGNCLIKEFAKQHKQNSDFVTRTVKHFINQDPSLSTQAALDKLYTNYVKK